MIRKVAFGKAALAGVLGASVWELAARLLVAAGVNAFDVTHALGSLFTTHAWWPVGMALHAFIGVIWAIFYAYFFWAELDLSPWLQGLVFAIVPAILAGIVMVPELGAMHEASYGAFAWRYGWAGPVSIFVGHAAYGLTLGALYTHPVGERVHGRVTHA